MNHFLFTICKISLVVIVLSAASIANATSQNRASEYEKHQYFRHIMFRESPYASYRGIHQLNVESSPNVAHYQFSYDSQGRVVEISYQINNNKIRGNEVWDSFIWFAPTVKIDYQSNKEIHSYYDIQDAPIVVHGNVFNAVYELNSKGERVALQFFDKEGRPSESSWNIHRYQWRRANGKVYETRFNLANQQQPLRPELQFYEVELDYDNDGKLTFMRNLGLDGSPTNNDSGAGIDRITYDQHGNFIRWQVYDKDGAPVEGNRPMVHLGEHLYDQFGNKVGLRGFDRYGRRIPFSWGAFEHVHTYDQFGNQQSHVIKKVDGSVDRHLELQYSTNNTEISWLRSLNESGSLVGSPMLGGAAAIELVYGQDGSLERKFYRADMSPFSPQASNATTEN